MSLDQLFQRASRQGIHVLTLQETGEGWFCHLHDRTGKVWAYANGTTASEAFKGSLIMAERQIGNLIPSPRPRALTEQPEDLL